MTPGEDSRAGSPQAVENAPGAAPPAADSPQGQAVEPVAPAKVAPTPRPVIYEGDLGTVGGTTPPPVGPPSEIVITPIITLIQEAVRAIVTVLFIGMLAYVIYYAAHGPNWKDQKDWLGVVLPAVTGLLGSALGFYFGTRQVEKRN